ncbi:MAG: site-specific integrase [Betaproteobacteria bacterium]|nr:MAG: site-specific integrase [Betaproteobacteria bacterium]
MDLAEKFAAKSVQVSTEQLEKLSCHELIDFSKFINRFRHKKFKSEGPEKYGNQVLTISEQEYQYIHSMWPEHRKWRKAKIIHAINRRTGRRVCEIVQLKAYDVDWQTQRVRFPRGKMRGGLEVWDEVWLADDAFQELQEYYKERKEEIKANNCFLFFSENPFRQEGTHVTSGYVQRSYYQVRDELGLLEPQYQYGETIERKHPRTGTVFKSKLMKNSLTSHRRAVGQDTIWTLDTPVALTGKVLGHTRFDTTMKYAQRPPQELQDSVMKKLYALNRSKVKSPSQA